MPDFYGDYRDTQRRWMHRPAPHLPRKFESKLFAAGELHDPAEGWTHDPNDAIARANSTLTPVLMPDTAVIKLGGGYAAPQEDDGEAIPLETTVAALKRPALLKLAAELGVSYDSGMTAAQLRAAILAHNGG